MPEIAKLENVSMFPVFLAKGVRQRGAAGGA